MGLESLTMDFSIININVTGLYQMVLSVCSVFAVMWVIGKTIQVMR